VKIFESIGSENQKLLGILKADTRKAFENLILTAPKDLKDEIAFTVANTPAPVLQAMYELKSHNILLENAKQIYSMAKKVKYARLKELPDCSTTIEYKRTNGKWEAIPKEIYYWWIVHPRILYEIPARVNCDYWKIDWKKRGMKEVDWLRHSEDIYKNPETGKFWRTFLQNDDFFDRKLIDYAQKAETFEEAIKQVHFFQCWQLPDSFMRFGYFTQDLQPIQIYYKAYGSCGEQSILGAALARTMLIPNTVITDHGEDHQWNEIFYFGEWMHWDVNHLDQDALWSSTEGWNHRGKTVSATNNWWGNDFSEDVTTRTKQPEGFKYTKSGKGYTDVAVINVEVVDANNQPVEAAMIFARSHWNNANRVATLKYSNAEGKAIFKLGYIPNGGFTFFTITSAGVAGIQNFPVQENKLYNLKLQVPGIQQKRSREIKVKRIENKKGRINFDFNVLKSQIYMPNYITSRPFRIASETIKNTGYRGTRNFPYPVKNDANMKLYLFTKTEFVKFSQGKDCIAFNCFSVRDNERLKSLEEPDEFYAVLYNEKSMFIHKEVESKISMKIPKIPPELMIFTPDKFDKAIEIAAGSTFEIKGQVSDNSNTVYLELSLDAGKNWLDVSEYIKSSEDSFIIPFPSLTWKHGGEEFKLPLPAGEYQVQIRARDSANQIRIAPLMTFKITPTRHYLKQVFKQDNPDSPLPKSSWMLGPFVIDSKTRFIAIKTKGHTQAFDLDLFLFYDKNGNMKIDSMNEVLKKSTTPTADENIFIATPKPGTYWIYAQGWQVKGDFALADIHTSFIYKPRLIRNISPVGKVTKAEKISAKFAPVTGIKTDSVKIFLNNVEITKQAAIENDGFEYLLLKDSKTLKKNVVRVELSDLTGNKDIVEWEYEIDNVKPAIKNLEFKMDANRVGYYIMSLTLNEVSKVSYAFDSEGYKQIRGGFKDKFENQTIDVFNLEAGKHIIKIKVVDAAGNETMDVKEFSVKAVKIAGRFLGGLADGKYLTRPNPTLVFMIKSEGVIREDSIIVLLDGKKFPGAVTLSKDRIYCTPYRSFDVGEHKIEIFVSDDKGNKLHPYTLNFARKHIK